MPEGKIEVEQRKGSKQDRFILPLNPDYAVSEFAEDVR